MKPRLFLIILFSLFQAGSYSQELLPKSCYLRLEGTPAAQTRIVMHLIKVNDSLYGDYSAGQVFGKITPKGKFWLKSDLTENTTEFKGQFKDPSNLTITLESPDLKGKKITFDMTVKYPEGSIPLKVFYESGIQKLVKDPKSPQATVKLSFLTPQLSENHSAKLDSLTNFMEGSFTENMEHQPETKNGEGIVEAVKTDFMESYVSGNAAMYKEMPGASFEWELLKFVHIVLNDDNKFTYYILNYTFTGGAHGLETRLYTSVDLKSGKRLQINDIFKSDIEIKLTALITSKIRQLAKLPPSGKLTEAGYFMDEVKPNDNFYITAQGVGFYYNHYEIAPYSFGTTDVFLTKEELKGLVK